MGEIVNLKRARKARDRDAAKAQAASRRARHGRSKAERDEAEAVRKALERTLDGAKRDD